MKHAGIVVLALISFCASAQFRDKWHVKFAVGTEPLEVKWADVDNDSLVDIVVASKINGRVAFTSYSDSAFLSVHELVNTGFASGTFSLSDFNRDNRIDIIMSGIDTVGVHSTEVYLNNGAFVYQKQAASLSAFSSPRVAFADLNSDGQDEFVMAGNGGHLSAWRWNVNSATHLFDSTDVVPKDILVYDFDGNGFNDIAVSGTDATNQPSVLIIEFANAFDTIRTIRFQSPLAGKMDAGDINNDGRLDLLISGIGSNGIIRTQSFLNQKTAFVPSQAWNGLDAASIRIADVDADRYGDMSVQGIQNASPVNFVRTFYGDSLALPAQQVMTQSFGDYDRDGDLDVVQMMDTLGLVVLENQTSNINMRPRNPAPQAFLFIYDRLFLYWTADWVADSVSYGLTYDLMLRSSPERYAAEFDTATWERTTVSHGNMSTNNFALLHLPVASYVARLQAVDNAFVGSKPQDSVGVYPEGFAMAGPPQCPPRVQRITACSNDPIKLTPVTPSVLAAWFSFSKGFMGVHDSLMVDNKPDTLFSLSMVGGLDCEKIRIYLIDNSSEDTVRVSHNTNACEGTAVDLIVAEEWMDITWMSPAEDSIRSGDTLRYVMVRDEVLTASAHNDHGCVLEQTENLHISKPLLTTNGDVFRIMRGESVGLVASGADVYVWTPNESLDNGFIPNPFASPSETTRYTLVGYDTLGCTDTTHVIVQVEQTAFVPNLFTPNGDGTNDQLKVYGLSQANNFRFAIHNRDGNIVYEASDVAAVTSRGWDGASHGVVQPPGLYYWKVEGTFDDGTGLKLNGRTTGSILMVR